MKHVAFTVILFGASIFWASALILSIRTAITTAIPDANPYPSDGTIIFVFLGLAAIFTALTINLGKDL